MRSPSSSAFSRSRAIPTLRSRNCARSPPTPNSTSLPPSMNWKAASASWPRAASISRRRGFPPRSGAGWITTPALSSNCTTSAIASQLRRGAVHLGVTGECLVRESIADADKRVLLIDSLGFGSANVVVAVPQAWIDVRTMADLDDVASGFREQHNRRMRVATKYINLTRAFFASPGVVDYRIIERAGAPEGAPALGTAEMIV